MALEDLKPGSKRIVNDLFAESADVESRRERQAVSTPVGPYSPSQVSYETFV